MRQLATSLEWNVCSTAHTHNPYYTRSHAYLLILVNYYTSMPCLFVYLQDHKRKRVREGVFSSQEDIYLSIQTEHTLHYINVCNSLFLLLFLLQTVTSGRTEGGFPLFIVHSYLYYRRISSYVYP